jgi:hypothetical protein
MPSFLKKISDYDRITQELEEAKHKADQLRRDLEQARSELATVQSQLESALEKAKDERRRRAEEEARRGSAERSLRDKEANIQELRERVGVLEEARSSYEGMANLEREANLEPGEVLAFVTETEFGFGTECTSAFLPGADCQSFLATVPGMASWASRMGKSERGLIGYISGRRACFLEPPLPIGSESIEAGESFALDPLEEFTAKRLVGFVSIHRDLYAVCLLDGELHGSSFESKEIIGKSKKGGFSQARYARSREDQFRHLVSEVNRAASDVFRDKEPEYVFVEGDDVAASALADSKGLIGQHRLVRFSLQSKITRETLEELPDLLWMWRGWVFELPQPFQPRG